MLKGDHVRLTIGSEVFDGEILMGSDNRKSLVVDLGERGVWVGPAFMIAYLALLWDEAEGRYRDLMTATPVSVEFITKAQSFADIVKQAIAIGGGPVALELNDEQLEADIRALLSAEENSFVTFIKNEAQ